MLQDNKRLSNLCCVSTNNFSASPAGCSPVKCSKFGLVKKINLRLVFKVVFSGALLAFLLTRLDREALKLLEWWVLPWMGAAVFITLIAMVLMAKRYQLMVAEFAGRRLPVLLMWRYYLIGAFFNIFLPGAIGGDIVRVQKLSKYHDVPLKKATLITLAERLTGMYGLVFLLSCSFAVGNVPDGFDYLSALPDLVLWLAPVLVLLFIPVLKLVAARFHVRFGYPFAIHTIAVLLLAQLGDVTIAWLFASMFDLHLPFTAFVFIMPIVYVATALPISLGGLGVREGVFAWLMTLYGVDVNLAVLISLLMYLAKVLVGLIGYTIYLADRSPEPLNSN